MPLVDLTGQTFGKLTVMKRSGTSCPVHWKCKCECGNFKVINGSSLKLGRSTSCGCLVRELGHGKRGTPTYYSWGNMIQRCTNPKATNYELYGGRGIRVCKRWMTFENFLKDMGERPAGTTLDREKSNLHYTKSNCRWSTIKVQNNNKRDNVYFNHRGKRITMKAAAKLTGYSSAYMYALRKKGLSIEHLLAKR